VVPRLNEPHWRALISGGDSVSLEAWLRRRQDWPREG
jgi:hypothetical protein